MKSGKASFLRSGAFLRLLLSYFVVIALVLLTFSAYMTYRAFGTVRQEEQNSQLNRLGRIAYRHEEYLSIMQSTANQMGVSPFIESFVYQEHPEKAYQLMQHLAPYAVTNTFCERMYVCFSADDHVYSSQNTMTMDLLCELMDFERLPDEELARLLHRPERITILPEQTVQSRLLDGGTAPIVTYVLPFGVPDGDKGSLMMLVRKDMFLHMFSDNVSLNNNTYILHGGQVLVSSRHFDIPDDAVLDACRAGSASFSYGGEQWLLTRVEGHQWDMEYLSVLRRGDLAPTFQKSVVPVLLLLLGLSLMAFLCAYWLARRNWRPVREISRLLSGPGDKRDDWQTIRSGISELSARNTDLSARLEKSLPMQRHEFVIQFVKNHFVSRQEAVLAASRVNLNIDRSCYAVVLCSEQETNNQPMDLSRPPFQEIEGVCGCGIELVAMDVNLYLLFSDTEAGILRAADMIFQKAQEMSGQAITAVSSIQQDFEKAPGAYLEAATAYDNRFVMDESKPLYYADIPLNISGILPQAHIITESINQALLLRNRDMLSGKIDELLQFLKRTTMNSFAFRLIYNDVIETLLKEHLDPLSRERGAQQVYDILSLTGCTNVDDLSDLLRRLCNFILAETADAREEAPSDKPESVMDQVISYIDTHFSDKELSISAISETFQMPIARLSLLFKEEKKMTPLEYLTMLRVEHSKTLLNTTDLPVKDIAEAVGYYDVSSFIRRFRQKTGTTPMQFRRHREGEGL